MYQWKMLQGKFGGLGREDDIGTPTVNQKLYLPYLIKPPTSPWGRYYHVHFKDEETEAASKWPTLKTTTILPGSTAGRLRAQVSVPSFCSVTVRPLASYFLVPQSPHLCNSRDSSTFHMGMLWRLNGCVAKRKCSICASDCNESSCAHCLSILLHLWDVNLMSCEDVPFLTLVGPSLPFSVCATGIFLDSHRETGDNKASFCPGQHSGHQVAETQAGRGGNSPT